MSKYKTQNQPSSFNLDTDGQRLEFEGFFERGMTSDKNHTVNGYLELLGDYFDRFEFYPTIGYGRRPYPFQWVAYAKPFIGDDDAYEGVGKDPTEAIRNLYHAIGADYPAEDDL